MKNFYPKPKVNSSIVNLTYKIDCTKYNRTNKLLSAFSILYEKKLRLLIENYTINIIKFIVLEYLS